MTDPRIRWQEQGKESGDYAMFAGFERDFKGNLELLVEAYESMDILTQLALFGYITRLLEEMADETG